MNATDQELVDCLQQLAETIQAKSRLEMERAGHMLEIAASIATGTRSLDVDMDGIRRGLDMQTRYSTAAAKERELQVRIYLLLSQRGG
jgi:hypothetical protein